MVYRIPTLFWYCPLGLYSNIGTSATIIHTRGGFIVDIVERIAEIKRRLRGLKAIRPSSLSQVNVFEISQSFNITLAGGATANFYLEINCSGTPLVSSSLDDFNLYPVAIVPQSTRWVVVGNKAYNNVRAVNRSAGTVTETVTVRGYSINGLYGTIVRLS